MEFIGVTLVPETIQVSSVQLNKISTLSNHHQQESLQGMYPRNSTCPEIPTGSIFPISLWASQLVIQPTSISNKAPTYISSLLLSCTEVLRKIKWQSLNYKNIVFAMTTKASLANKMKRKHIKADYYKHSWRETYLGASSTTF